MSAGDPLDRALDRASGARPIPGNAVRLLDAPGALAAMLNAVRAAGRCLRFENYIIRADATGRRFAEALTAAAGRGVAVQVLYDPIGCRTTPARFWRRLRDGGCAVRPANPPSLWHPLRAFRRDHRKLVSVDGTRALLGGVCIGDAWAGDLGRNRPAWRDAAVEVQGPAVTALDQSFDRLWRDTGGEPLPPAAQVPVRGEATIRVVEGVPGGFRLHRAVELLAAVATHQLWITDAYLVAPPSLLRALVAAARDGVDVRLLVPGRTDLPVVRAFTRAGYRDLLRAGVRIWEWHGPMLHSKTALVDRHRFKVGSSNLNLSSLMGNWELDALVDDPALGNEAAQAFRRDLSNAVEIVLRRPRVPAALAGRLPPAVTPAARPPRRRAPVRELPHRAVQTLRQVAGGARRSLVGAATFALAGVGVLSLTLPRFVAYLLAGVAFALAGLAGSRFLGRWRD